jgi:hypothetical protein
MDSTEHANTSKKPFIKIATIKGAIEAHDICV